MDNIPKVSVIMPTLNGARHIREAIDSVLFQTFRDFEFIIMDDGSSDETEAVVKSCADPRIIYAKNEKTQGLTKSLNACLRMAHGEYVARIDDDDAWSNPSKLRLQVLYLDAHPRCVLLGTWFVAIGQGRKELFRQQYPTGNHEIRERMLFENPFAHPAVVFRRTAALSVGGYSEQYRFVQDYDMWMKLGTKGELANLPGYYLKWRAADGSQDARRAGKQKRAAKQWTIVSIIWHHKTEYPHFAHAFVKAVLKWILFLVFPKPGGIEQLIGVLRRRMLPKF